MIGAESLTVKFAGLKFRNPTMLASGFLGISQEILDRIYLSGAGCLVSKSLSNLPIEGYRNPTVIDLNGKSYLNAVGLANPGFKAFATEIKANKTPLILSLVGSDQKDFILMVKRLDNLNILGYEINLSCPHVKKMGMEVGDDLEMVRNIIRKVRINTRKPIFIKLGVGNMDILKLAEVAKDENANGVTAINTIRAMAINVQTGSPILSNRLGGLSGRSIKPVAIRCVYEISKKLGIPVIGCGGIFMWEDAIEFLLAGASAVQIGSGVGHSGIGIFKLITRGIKNYLENKGFRNVQDIVGLAHKY
ncbi:MAG: dihydroorotate dehydrogenase [Nitrososphaeraceae archaeon]|jgi:dihydroorotate dehydrogenase (NAD+) catalytic subunit